MSRHCGHLQKREHECQQVMQKNTHSTTKPQSCIYMNQQVAIDFNKKKILPHLLGALVFVMLGTGMMGLALQAKNQLLAQVVFFTVGLAGLLFFGLIAVVHLMKMAKNKPALIITDDGLFDNSSGLSAGFIKWQDIKKLNFTRTGNQASLVIILKKPDKYIERESNFLKRAAMRINNKMSGSPVHIPLSYLDTDWPTLSELIANKRLLQKPIPGQE
jgi:hypothetical protein